MKYTCIKKCFFRARVWAVGEILQSTPDEVVPKFFTTKEVKAAPVIPVDDPKSFAEFQRKEARELLSGVGHGAQAAKDPTDIFG